MSMYAVVGIVLIVAVAFLLRKRRENSSTGSPPVKEEPISPQEPTHKVEPATMEYPVTIYKDGVPMKGWAKEMPQGLQVFDKTGKIKVDMTKRLTKVLGVMTISGTGELTFEQYPNQHPWMVVLVHPFGVNNEHPVLGITDRRIYWKNTPAPYGGMILYGVY